MRLRYGPHAGKCAEQILLRDPQYALWWMSERPDAVLAGVFLDLVVRFDARPFVEPCARCGAPAACAYAYPTLTELIPMCRRCRARPALARLKSAHEVSTIEDALRHVTETLPRGHRKHMRRIVSRLALTKGGPVKATEAAATAFFQGVIAGPGTFDRPNPPEPLTPSTRPG